MDSRDSSTVTASYASRDGSLSEEDAVTAAIANDAQFYFQSGNFAESTNLLIQLKKKKPNDPKVHNNMALVEYFRDGCSNTKKLLEALYHVKKWCEELDSAEKESTEAVNPGNEGVMSKDEFDSTVTILNIAVTWFHMHEYSKALSVLKPLFCNIEPLEEKNVLPICFLLLDVSLACRNAAKFVEVLNYMLKAYGVGCGSQGENGSTIQVARTSSLPSGSLALDATKSDSAGADSEETLEYDNVLAEIGVQKSTKAVGHFLGNNHHKAIGDRSISTIDLKLELQLYKVRFLLLTQNVKLAKRELKLAMNIARARDSSVALLLKSQLEYARGNHLKAIKLLMVSGIQTETKSSSIFNNNLGCIYYQLGDYHTSCVLFSKALRSCPSLSKEKPLKLRSLSQDAALLIMYNCGLNYLSCGKPLLAVRCFQKASIVFYRQPLLWLRIAECCLMALELGLLEEGNNASVDKSKVRLHVIGKGKWRHLLMEENRNAKVDGNTRWPKPSLTLARLCLSNASYLVNEIGSHVEPKSSLEINELEETPSSDPAKGGMSQDMIKNSLASYNDVRTRETHYIKQVLLASMAYVELEIENAVKALSAANSLLETRDCSNVFVFLGHLYAAEALCLLNRPKDAAAHLSIYLPQEDNNFKLPFVQEELDQWRKHRNVDSEDSYAGEERDNNNNTGFLKPEEARGVLCGNLAALLATQGDLDGAQHLVAEALSFLPNNAQATVTAIYIDLMFGRSQEAIARLKKYNRISFLSGGLQL